MLLYTMRTVSWAWAHYKDYNNDDNLKVQYTYDLQIGNADVETLVHVGVPNDPNIGDEERTEIPLETRRQNQQTKYKLNDEMNDILRRGEKTSSRLPMAQTRVDSLDGP